MVSLVFNVFRSKCGITTASRQCRGGLMQFGRHDQLFVPLQVTYNQLIFKISFYKSKYFYATTKTKLEMVII